MNTNALHLPDPGPIEEQATQVQRPWRATARTVLAALWGLIPLWPAIVSTSGLSTSLPWVATSIVVVGAITRVTAMPGFEAWLCRYLPILAADPDCGSPGKHRAPD